MSAAVKYFRKKLAFEIDAVEAAAGLEAGAFTLIDARRHAAWEQGHIPGAVHLPTAMIPAQAHVLVPAGSPVVVYSEGPGCTAATRAALAFAELGYPVRELVGGLEYWARRGLPVEAGDGESPEGATAAGTGQPEG